MAVSGRGASPPPGLEEKADDRGLGASLEQFGGATSEAVEVAVEALLELLWPLAVDNRDALESSVQSVVAQLELSVTGAAEDLMSQAQREANAKLKAQTLQLNLKLERARTASRVEKKNVAAALAEEHSKAMEQQEQAQIEKERSGGNPALTEAHQQIAALSRQLETLRQAKEETDRELQQSERALSQAQVRIHKLVEQHSSLTHDNEAWMRDIKPIRASLAAAQAELEAAEADKARIRDAAAEGREMLAGMASVRDALRECLEATAHEVEMALPMPADAAKRALSTLAVRIRRDLAMTAADLQEASRSQRAQLLGELTEQREAQGKMQRQMMSLSERLSLTQEEVSRVG